MAKNPVLTEIQTKGPTSPALSPSAQNAARMAGFTPDTAMGVAPAVPIAMPSQVPSLSMPSQMPSFPMPSSVITGPNKGEAILSDGGQPAPAQMHQVERNRLIAEGPGEDQLYGKIAGSHFGQAHPFLGKLLGGLAEGGAKLADVGASTLLPQLTEAIPGTASHHQLLLNQANRAVSQDEANAQKEAQTAAENAMAEHTAAETPEVAPNAESERELQGATKANLESETSARNESSAQGPDLAVAYSHAVNQAIKNGQDPSQDPIVQHLSDAITAIQKQPTPKGLMQSQPILGPDGKPHTYLLDPTTGAKVQDLGVHYEKPNVTNINAGEKTWEYANNQLNTLGKPIADLNMRMGRLRDTLAAGTPQADALVSPELLTVMAGGQGSGLRMNEAEISRIVGGRSHWENLRGAMQKWSTNPETANSITPDQRQQIHELVNAVNAKLQAKQNIINDAANQMVNVDDPKEQRKILAETRQKLQSVDEGNTPQGGGKQNDPLGIR